MAYMPMGESPCDGSDKFYASCSRWLYAGAGPRWVFEATAAAIVAIRNIATLGGVTAMPAALGVIVQGRMAFKPPTSPDPKLQACPANGMWRDGAEVWDVHGPREKLHTLAYLPAVTACSTQISTQRSSANSLLNNTT